MKRKRPPKAEVPEGAIWWREQKRHPLNHYVGRVIHRLRTGRGWSFEDLAKGSGLSSSYLCELERGKHSPSLEVQLRLEQVFDMARGGLMKLAQGEMRRAL